MLLRDIGLIIFARNGYPKPDEAEHLAKGYVPFCWIGAEDGFVGKYSSTQIRKDLWRNRNEKPAGLDPKVYRYIVENDLYRE